jgi:MFS family permease
MKKIKKALMTIIWTIVACFIGAVITGFLHDIFNWVIPCLCVLLALVLSIKGKLPGTDIEKIIVPKRKKTPWYLWKFSFGSIFLLYIFGFTTYSMIKNMELHIIYILMDILLLSIFILCVISVWEDRKEIEFRIDKKNLNKTGY